MLPLPRLMGNKGTQTIGVSACSKSQQKLQYVARKYKISNDPKGTTEYYNNFNLMSAINNFIGPPYTTKTNN